MISPAAGILRCSLLRVAESRTLSRSLPKAAGSRSGRSYQSQVRMSSAAGGQPNVWPTNPGLSTISDSGVIRTEKAPAPVGAYSQAIQAGNTLYVSGQLGLDPQDSKMVAEDAAGQAKQALENMGAILRAAGTSFDHVVKTTVLLADLADFKSVNEVYGIYFSEKPPARVCYAVKALPLNAKVEIDAIAVTSGAA